MKLIAPMVFYIMALGTPISLILLHILHRILPKEFDKIWFNEKFFNKAELAIYSSYPMSLLRTLIYAAAISLPFLMKNRFDDLHPAEQTSPTNKRLVYSFLYLIILIFFSSIFTMITVF